MSDDLASLPADVLAARAAQEIEAFRRSGGEDHASEHGLALLRRAIHDDDAALDALMFLLNDYLAHHLPPDLDGRAAEYMEKADQRVRGRLRSKNKPFVAQHFGGFLKHVRLNCRSVAYHMRHAQQREETIRERPGERDGVEPPPNDPRGSVDLEPLYECLGRLSAEERQIVEARYMYEQSYAEIEAETGLPRKRLFDIAARAMLKLRRCMAKNARENAK